MNVNETLKQVIEGHNLIHIASIDADGHPCVRGVDYASDEDCNLYFVTHKDTRKVAQMNNDQHISFVIDHDCADMDALLKLKYIKGNGIAKEIANPEEIQKAMGLLMKKFPFFENLPLPPQDMKAFRIEPKEVLVTDNTISFGHTEVVNL
jgi:nitroimidazol reductase NimA-like FMN-containing flavoprotein (pyridoxamine 5'-phosphate oxidase superfamily)